MPTLKQERLAQNLTGNYRSYKEAALAAGYSEGSLSSPAKVVRTIGVQERKAELLAEFEKAGITSSVKINRIKKIIEGRNDDKAVEQIWKLLEFEYGKGVDKLADTINTQVNIVMSPESIEESVMLWISSNPEKHQKVLGLLTIT